MNVALTHTTKYRYSSEVKLGPQIIKLHPAPHCRTFINSFKLDIQPTSYLIEWQQDEFLNHVAKVTFTEKTKFVKVAKENGKVLTKLRQRRPEPSLS